MYYRNQKGLTLIEVLLSIVILSIILVTFMKFFPQMGMMYKQNENKQQAVNVAKELLIDWQKKGDALNSFISNPSNSVIPGYKSSDTKYYYFQEKRYDFDVEIIIKKNPDLNGSPFKAYPVHIKLKSNKGNIITETYGYIIIS